MAKIKKHWLLMGIIVLAAFFRLYTLASVPPSPSLDEVSIGWNAYSILHTGKDEYGTRLPWMLRAYDDFRPALYVYLVSAFIPFLGLSVTAVRLPSVLLSISSVLATYLLANRLLEGKAKKFRIGSIICKPGHIAALFLAISPWHIYISRLGHEVNLALSLCIWGNVCFFMYLAQKKQSLSLLILAVVLWVASFGSYQSEKIIIPLIVGCCIVMGYRSIVHKKDVVIAGMIGLLLSLPTFLTTFSPEGLTRYAGTSAFTESNPLYEQERQQFILAQSDGDIVGRFWHHPRLTSGKIFFSNYTKHFSVRWLFYGGPFESHKIPYTGLIHWWLAPFFVLGVYAIFRQVSRAGIFILFLLVIAPIPGSITTQAPHAMRSFTFLPAWELLATIGLLFISERVRGVVHSSLVSIVSVVALFTTISMFQRYVVIFPKTQSQAFGYSLYQSLLYLRDHYDVQKTVVLANTIRADLSRPISLSPEADFQTYMYYLFVLRYDPKLYQQQGGTKSGGIGQQFSFGNVKILDFRDIPLEKGTIYIGKKSEIPPFAHFLFDSKYLDDTPGISVATAPT